MISVHECYYQCLYIQVEKIPQEKTQVVKYRQKTSQTGKVHVQPSSQAVHVLYPLLRVLARPLSTQVYNSFYCNIQLCCVHYACISSLQDVVMV